MVMTLAKRSYRVQLLFVDGELPIGAQLVGVQHGPVVHKTELSLESVAPATFGSPVPGAE